MSFGFGLALPSWQTLSGGFSPASLFAAGEQGVWYQIDDLTTLFQDSAGTTPVTAVEQPVGLMLDKSQGLVLGPELVLSPYIGSASGSWTVGATSITRNGSASGQATVNLGATVSTSKKYRVVFTVANISGDSFYYTLGGGSNRVQSNGVVSAVITPGSAVSYFQIAPWAGTAGEATITGISVRELPGNHASQTTSTARPTLRARYNLLTYSEDFSNVIWTKERGSISVDAAIAPNGALTADKYVEDSTTGYHRLAFSPSLVVGARYTTSIYAKASGRRYLVMNSLATLGARTVFDLQLGTANTIDGSGEIVNVGSDWYRCSVSGVCVATGQQYIGTNTSSVDGPYTGDGTSGIFIWGADLRVATESASLPVYQRVAAATDYDTSGFPPYLAFDGSDDSMATSAINFSATDKMSVFAGVRKLSDAARGTVVELTASAAANNGAFHMTAPNAASATFAFESKGTVLTDAVEADNVPAAPVTVALTGLGNISGDSTIIRVNGVQEDIDTGDQGTGNYANAAMFIGARNQASLFFNGRLYSLIVLGRAATAAEIVSTEEYVEQKTFGKALSLVYSDELQTADGDQITMDDGDPIYMTVAYQ